MPGAERIQLHLELQYRMQPRDHPKIGALLDRGFRIADLQRVTDKEVVITLVRPASETS
jgi:hypothetical protein